MGKILQLSLLALFIFTNNSKAINGDLGVNMGANGNANAPWLIEDYQDFLTFCADNSKWNINQHTKLCFDINLSPELTNRQIYNSALISPSERYNSFIGTAFRGNFNGNNHKIYNLTFNAGTKDNGFLSVFGKIQTPAIVSNLRVDFSITGTGELWYLAAICGRSDGGTIENCHATGEIMASTNAHNIGGLCGFSCQESTVINSSAHCLVAGTWEAGGICGYSDGDITNCITTGNISGIGYLGGLCGSNGPGGTITNCHAYGNVTGQESSYYVGGLCGYNSSYVGKNSRITQSSAHGTVYCGTGSHYIGGLSGYNSTFSISSCYADGSILYESSSEVGGLCGIARYGTVENCYAAVNIENINGGSASGLCGSTGSSITFSDCYVTGKSWYAICGDHNNSSSIFINCFWDIDTCEAIKDFWLGTDYPGTVINVVGLNTEQMQNLAMFHNAGWDIQPGTSYGTENIWRMPYIQPGYPILSWQKDIPGDFCGKYGVDIQDFSWIANQWLINYSLSDLCDLANFWLFCN